MTRHGYLAGVVIAALIAMPGFAQDNTGNGTLVLPQAGASETDPQVELTFWNSVKDSDNPAMFEAYLTQFPHGVFVPIAQAKLQELYSMASEGGSDAGSGDTGTGDSGGEATAPTAPATPSEAYAEAQSIMAGILGVDPTQRAGEVARATALFEQAGAGGISNAYMQLGQIFETGQGTFPDASRAADYYLRAAEAGVGDGYTRALSLLSRANDQLSFTDAYVKYYRANPAAALASLGAYPGAAIWVQTFLRAQGYYKGAIDGDFGPGSQSALAAYASGAGPTTTVVVRKPGKTPTPKVSDRTKRAKALQRQLTRAGCYYGPIDGQWGPASIRAMRKFNAAHGTRKPSAFPSEAALAELRATHGRVCY